ncbi:MAG: TMEM165/GDT1 family protein [Myxococcota bacterium]
MDWRLAASTFGLIFLAELGDKTQLATLGLATGTRSLLAIFVGASLALVATTAIAVVLGEAAARLVPELWLRRGAGALFVGVGLFFLLVHR